MKHIINEINEAFRSCFSKNQTLLSAETTNDIDAGVQESIKERIPQLLNNYLSDPTYKVKGSVGAGRATKTPWIAILDKDLTTTTREGVYIVFLFSSDCKNVYITLNQGTTQPNQFGPRLGIREVTRKAQNIRTLLNINNTLLQMDGKADIYDEKYKAGAIYYTLWDANDEDKCKKLIDLYLNIYKQYKTMTTSPTKSKTDNILPKHLPYLTALRTKPFMLLAGISGTGKSRIVRKLAQATNTKEYANEEDRWKDNRPDNFQLIQVKPNWHNSMDVVGFLSNIPEPHYVFTDFVRFIVKAWQHPETPYFLCLDEMNLAPVEEYFAEFLSAIESRAWDEEGNYTTDPIISPFKVYGKDVCEAMLKELLGEAHHTEANPLAIQFEEKGLTLPPNLMVMGTVNMDETTFSFSRKVLDRAMSVEMNEVNYDDFKEGKTELMPLLTDYNNLLVNRPQKAQEVQEEIDSQKVIDYLKAVNELLDGTPFKLGYRAANEAILYVAASQEFAKEAFSIETAMDEFTLMKILSRIEGDDSRLAIDENDERLQKAGLSESPLDNGEQNLTLLNGLRAIVRQHIGINTATEKKINHMYTTLCKEHFVSYWA